VKRKIQIQVAGNPQYAKKPNKASVICNPVTGLPSFGDFPSIDSQGVIFKGGPIYLRYGEHRATGAGWGFEHIWKARFHAVIEVTQAQALVTNLLNRILIQGATIHYEFGTGSAHRRSSVFRSRAGLVVVEERSDGLSGNFYSIVTAFEARQAHGPIVGRMK
jgi:hypothetical protein